jgi:hypothetical protein
MSKRVCVMIDNNTYITDILKIIEREGGDIETASIDATPYKDYNSYGDDFAVCEVELSFNTKS